MLPPQPPATFRPLDRATRQQKREHEQQMRAWLAHRLEQQMYQAAKMTADEYCKRLARAGNPVPLRQRYPHLAEFIHAPKLRRGQRYAKYKKRTYAGLAADYAKCIRSLWREQYGDVRRPRGEKTAEDFAIDILRERFEGTAQGAACAALTVEAVEAAAKPSGKHKPGPRTKAK